MFQFQAADEDGDNSLTFDEYKAYLHPEEFARMKDVVLDETLSDMDKNGDGMLDMEEYMSMSTYFLYNIDNHNVIIGMILLIIILP